MIRSRLTYLALLIAAFVFSQALYDSISLFTLAVVLLLPIVSLLCFLISLMLVKVRAIPAPARVDRMQTAVMKVQIDSKTPLMLPMMKFGILASNPTGDASVKGYTVAHYRAFGKSILEIPLRFNTRGVYEVGIDWVEFYDFMKLFRIRRKIACRSNITAYPRDLHLALPLNPSAQEQENTVTAGGRETKNDGDLSGIREFNENDSLRNVHWKLSARLSKMIVKTYWENSCQNIMVLADLFPYEEDLLLNRRLTDGVVEAVLEVSSLLAEQGVHISLGYPTNDGLLQMQSITTIEEQIAVADAFAMVPMMKRGSLEQSLSEVDFSSLQGGALYIVTSMPAEELTKALRPYLLGSTFDLQCFLLRPEQEPCNQQMKLITLEDLEGGVEE